MTGLPARASRDQRPLSAALLSNTSSDFRFARNLRIRRFALVLSGTEAARSGTRSGCRDSGGTGATTRAPDVVGMGPFSARQPQRPPRQRGRDVAQRRPRRRSPRRRRARARQTATPGATRVDLSLVACRPRRGGGVAGSRGRTWRGLDSVPGREGRRATLSEQADAGCRNASAAIPRRESAVRDPWRHASALPVHAAIAVGGVAPTRGGSERV